MSSAHIASSAQTGEITMDAAAAFQLQGPLLSQMQNQAAKFCHGWCQQQGDDNGAISQRRLEFFDNQDSLLEDIAVLVAALKRCRARRRQRQQWTERLEQTCVQMVNLWGNACLERYYDGHHGENDDKNDNKKRNSASAFDPNAALEQGCDLLDDRNGTAWEESNKTTDEFTRNKKLRTSYTTSPVTPSPLKRRDSAAAVNSKSKVVGGAIDLITIDDSDHGSEQHLQQELKERQELPTTTQRTDDATSSIADLVRKNQWQTILKRVQADPSIATRSLQVGDRQNFQTTLLHQAVISETNPANTKDRLTLIQTILQQTPEAAKQGNGRGNLPIHVLCNALSMDMASRLTILQTLMHANPQGLLATTQKHHRTPLHILCAMKTFSRQLIQCVLNSEHGAMSASRKDAQGYLAVHIACSNHCSGDIFNMLLNAAPQTILATTPEGHTPLSLAISTATDRQNNQSLLQAIEIAMETAHADPTILVPNKPVPNSIHEKEAASLDSCSFDQVLQNDIPEDMDDISLPAEIAAAFCPPNMTLQDEKVDENLFAEQQAILSDLCGTHQWHLVLQCVRKSPQIALAPMKVSGNQTSLLHQAIAAGNNKQNSNGKNNVGIRVQLICTILRTTPEAAAMRNSFASLPVHVIASHNVNLTIQHKVTVLRALVEAYPAGLLEGTKSNRQTPLHIICKSRGISPQLIECVLSVADGILSTFVADANGFLPIHLACYNRCSVEVLGLLLEANPRSLTAATLVGDTILSLATSSSQGQQKSNGALVAAIQRALAAATGSESNHGGYLYKDQLHFVANSNRLNQAADNDNDSDGLGQQQQQEWMMTQGQPVLLDSFNNDDDDMFNQQQQQLLQPIPNSEVPPDTTLHYHHHDEEKVEETEEAININNDEGLLLYSFLGTAEGNSYPGADDHDHDEGAYGLRCSI